MRFLVGPRLALFRLALACSTDSGRACLVKFNRTAAFVFFFLSCVSVVLLVTCWSCCGMGGEVVEVDESGDEAWASSVFGSIVSTNTASAINH